jgi:hypothetical protein
MLDNDIAPFTLGIVNSCKIILIKRPEERITFPGLFGLLLRLGLCFKLAKE